MRPDLRYGLQNTFRYGNLRFYVQLNGQLGGDVYGEPNSAPVA